MEGSWLVKISTSEIPTVCFCKNQPTCNNPRETWPLKNSTNTVGISFLVVFVRVYVKLSLRSFKACIVHTAVFSCQCRCRRQRRPVNTSQQEVSWSEVNI